MSFILTELRSEDPELTWADAAAQSTGSAIVRHLKGHLDEFKLGSLEGLEKEILTLIKDDADKDYLHPNTFDICLGLVFMVEKVGLQRAMPLIELMDAQPKFFVCRNVASCLSGESPIILRHGPDVPRGT